MNTMDGAGVSLNDACRLLDAEAVRTALRGGKEAYALCVSDAVYWGTVRQNHAGIRAEEFRQLLVPVKKGVLQSWLYQPLPV
ncbi:hypothetical protein [Streptomyces sp. CS62]|uniref:hypothetical protein n=1 Tax=Streptomyces sp. CS62 TaxID=3119268 RepID=UPI002F93A4FB